MVLKRKSKNVDASLNFRNDSGGRLSPLNGSIRNPNYLRAKAFGFPPPRHPGNFRAGVYST